MKKAPLTGQELHNLAMNIVGNALRNELQWVLAFEIQCQSAPKAWQRFSDDP